MMVSTSWVFMVLDSRKARAVSDGTLGKVCHTTIYAPDTLICVVSIEAQDWGILQCTQCHIARMAESRNGSNGPRPSLGHRFAMEETSMKPTIGGVAKSAD
jgi:hypothetical protein